jgi:periplasmic protein CpxP/Spy
MKTPKTAFLATLGLAAALLGSAAIAAQAPKGSDTTGKGRGAYGKDRGAEGRLHRLGRMAEYLDLTEQQQASARQLFQSFAEKARSLREGQRGVREQLRTALDAPNPDPAQVGRLVIQMHDTGEQVRAARQEMDKSFAALLTPEQRAKYDALKDARDSFGPRRFGRRGHRHGGAEGGAFGR